ncbi:MAG: cupin [Candidatus Vogelbacteria bacterium CG22_combo_CG10-13_8_21_14_all_37_9]|uniref:Cupin n=1 Tax=Candidatus Vogelbacteria bacterium CG22_combo_CG10-13_8_21_14_all_37_9 TaxID=1975046 RepID=A0A2H0BKR3_9BACT|nr:MAG: cupin [Candidatus Vogelbacteria bacterium CG22_combo_CG10-13_8_21_14_all_37_9]
MIGYIANIEKETLTNENFRKVLFTTPLSQLVVMSLLPGEDIGEEVHTVDQFFRIEVGEGKVIIDGVGSIFVAEFAFVVPAGAKHNVFNTSASEKLKLYTIYTPPNHKDGTIHVTKALALADETDHF